MFTSHQTVLVLLDEANSTFTLEAPLVEFSVSEKLFFPFEQAFFLLYELVFDRVSVLEDFSEGLVLEEVVLHVAAKKGLEELTLLGDEVA